MKRLKLGLSLLLLAGAFFLCQQVVTHSRDNQRAKSDYAELNSVTYGLFSIDAWKEQLVAIVTSEMEQLQLTPQTEKELRVHVATVLNKMIDEAASKIEKANNKTTIGKMKQAFIDTFVDIKDIKTGIPEYTDAVIRELKKAKTKKQIKTLVDTKIAEFATKTADVQDRSQRDAIVAALGVKDVEAARTKLGASIESAHRLIVAQSAALIGVALGIFALFAFTKAPTPAAFFIQILSLVTLLAAGIATPMIDMEARISQLKFVLIGHQILFENQILYFQSKSILDVFWLMVTDSQLQMKLVGILVVSFSLVFPLLKLLATVAYYFDFKGSRRRAVIDFFVHKSGKWSMADVMVVAIFMAYIGFNGVIDSQLKELNFPGSGVDVIATNGTSLQPGYFIFLTYVLVAVLFSSLLSRLTVPVSES